MFANAVPEPFPTVDDNPVATESIKSRHRNEDMCNGMGSADEPDSTAICLCNNRSIAEIESTDHWIQIIECALNIEGDNKGYVNNKNDNDRLKNRVSACSL